MRAQPVGRARLCQGRVTRPPRGGVCRPSRLCRPQEGRNMRELSRWGLGGWVLPGGPQHLPLAGSGADGARPPGSGSGPGPSGAVGDPSLPGAQAETHRCCRPQPRECARPGVCGARVTRAGGAGAWREHVECMGGVARGAIPRAARSRVFVACLPCARSQAREEKGRAPAAGGHFPWGARAGPSSRV